MKLFTGIKSRVLTANAVNHRIEWFERWKRDGYMYKHVFILRVKGFKHHFRILTSIQ